MDKEMLLAQAEAVGIGRDQFSDLPEGRNNLLAVPFDPVKVAKQIAAGQATLDYEIEREERLEKEIRTTTMIMRRAKAWDAAARLDAEGLAVTKDAITKITGLQGAWIEKAIGEWWNYQFRREELLNGYDMRMENRARRALRHKP